MSEPNPRKPMPVMQPLEARIFLARTALLDEGIDIDALTVVLNPETATSIANKSGQQATVWGMPIEVDPAMREDFRFGHIRMREIFYEDGGVAGE